MVPENQMKKDIAMPAAPKTLNNEFDMGPAQHMVRVLMKMSFRCNVPCSESQ